MILALRELVYSSAMITGIPHFSCRRALFVATRFPSVNRDSPGLALTRRGYHRFHAECETN